MGPTASGKTDFAIKLYRKLPIEIISVDSAKIYRGMDIGTSKPSMMQRLQVPHRLIDICDPSDSYSVANFCSDAMNEMKNITDTGRIPILVGGSMLYFKALLEGLSILPAADSEIRSYILNKAKQEGWMLLHKKLQKIDPISANRIHPNDIYRILRALEVFLLSGKTLTELKIINPIAALSYKVYQFAIIPNRILLHKKIETRFNKMLNNGFENEVRMLFDRDNLHRDMQSIRCVGYRQMWEYLSGEINYEYMMFKVLCATRQLAKRQITWLKKWSNIHVLDNNQSTNILIDLILQIVNN